MSRQEGQGRVHPQTTSKFKHSRKHIESHLSGSDRDLKICMIHACNSSAQGEVHACNPSVQGEAHACNSNPASSPGPEGGGPLKWLKETFRSCCAFQAEAGGLPCLTPWSSPAVLPVVTSGRDRKQGVDLHSACGHMSPSVTGPSCPTVAKVHCTTSQHRRNESPQWKYHS